uniref:Uncharacterized protein n=1 Tax=Arundo donax TaxID=35708 RepID=A0A0A8YKL3_ARUDO
MSAMLVGMNECHILTGTRCHCQRLLVTWSLKGSHGYH